ncbi:hypothetical protein N7450_007310 [Penicillium hetheringtonii]|uniref:Piwi domain-containing protein n=1 Tax=Penicillium hetheringtonii TaxID=911720 RepID=A0AAD6DHD1_9EURO|nr:hypothetical protein N7450_007310 [Penicillium hetheringtonii]
MSENRGRGRGRGDRGDRGDRGRGGPRGGGRGRGRGGEINIPFRPAEGRGGYDNYRGRGDRGRGDRGRGGGDRGRGRGGGDRTPTVYRAKRSIPAPDPEVVKTENTLAKSLVGFKKAEQAYPLRPGYGTQGEEVTLYANYMSLTGLAKGKLLHRYNVEVAAEKGREAPTGKKARQIISCFIDEHFQAQKRHIATDYGSVIVSVVDLNLKEDQILDVRYKSEGEAEYPENPRVYQVRCASIRKLDSADLINYLTSTNAGALLATKAELVTALNIIIGHHPKTSSDVVSVGANKHFGTAKNVLDSQSLGGGLEVLRGFFISVRAATARVLLNVQVKYAACYKAGSLVEVIQDFTNSKAYYYAKDFKKNLLLGRFLQRMRIMPNHIKRKSSRGKARAPPVKTIIGLAKRDDGRLSENPPKVPRDGAGPDEVQFFLRGQTPSAPKSGGKKAKGQKPPAGPAPAGKYITVAQYFSQTYNMKVNEKFPVVNVGSRSDPNYLPVEACEVPIGQTVNSRLSPEQTNNMLGFAVRGRSPAQNAEAITTNGVGILGIDPLNETLAAFGVGISPNLITVKGRVLPAPTVFYQGQKAIEPARGSWNMQDIKFCKPGSLKNWTFLFIGGRGFNWKERDAMTHVITFAGHLRKLGINVEAPKMGISMQPYPEGCDIAAAVKQLLDQYGHLDLILGIMPNADTGTYNSIKQVCDVMYGVRNVNVQAGKLVMARGLDQYCANVGLKVNLKLGGTNQSLQNMGLFGDGKTMLVGLDVTHPSPGSSDNAPSVAGIVASVDKDLAQWPADIVVQKRRDEMNIVVYRDGVSEGQYNLVIDKELPLLKNACESVYPAAQTAKGLPRIAIIIVGKRHNTRFYPTNPAQAERSSNPQPGTVVDRGISEGRQWDWYQQAHSCLQGTARPAHYFTVWDEIFHPKYPSNANGPGAADILQELTHKMCYLFGRATKAVSVCPPAYYADLVCTRARCYLQDYFDPSPSASVADSKNNGTSEPLPSTNNYRPHERIKNTMFYI